MIYPPQPGFFYRHFKGGNYLCVALAKHTETGEDGVIMRNNEHGTYSFRPISSWMNPAQTEHGPAGCSVPRFVQTYQAVP